MGIYSRQLSYSNDFDTHDSDHHQPVVNSSVMLNMYPYPQSCKKKSNGNRPEDTSNDENCLRSRSWVDVVSRGP